MAVYKVTITAQTKAENLAATQTRLIEASTKAGAINFAAKDSIKAEVLGTADAVALGAEGLKVEKAE